MSDTVTPFERIEQAIYLIRCESCWTRSCDAVRRRGRALIMRSPGISDVSRQTYIQS
jgi:hypothetical protein